MKTATDASAKVLTALYELEAALRELPPARRTIGVDLVVTRVRRLIPRRPRQGPRSAPQDQQVDLEEYLLSSSPR